MSISFNKKNIQQDPILQEVTSFKFKDKDINKRIASFTWGIFDIIYYLGRLQTRPIHRIAERFQNLRYKDDSISLLTKIRMTFLVIICIPTAILTIPGAAMLAFAKKFSKNFSYSPTSEQPNPITANSLLNQNALKIMTWNTGLGPGFMSIDNRLKRPQERVENVLDMIKSQDPHIVALQEVFDSDAKDKIIEQLNDQGYDCIHSVLSSDPLALSSGLLLAVKRNSSVKISLEEIKVWQFKNLAGPDAFSNKGVLSVRIKLSTENGQEQKLYIFNTHLQASYSDAGYGEVRQEQVAAIVSKVNAWSNSQGESHRSIVCGDLNFGHAPLEVLDDRKLTAIHPSKENEKEDNEYYVQMQEFARAQLFDPNEAAQQKGEGTFCELKKGNPYRVKSVVDYILVSESLKTTSSSSKIVDLNLNNLPSDHYPVVHQLAMNQLFSTTTNSQVGVNA